MATITADSKEAHAYLIDPLTGSDPSDETGLNSHFRSTFAPASPLHTPPNPATTPPKSESPKVETNPFRRASVRSSQRDSISRFSEGPFHDRAYPTPPNSASPKRDSFATDHRAEAFGAYNPQPRPRRYSDAPKAPSPGRALPARGSSLRQRYPGDRTHEPLKMLTKDAQAAQRSPHLRKKHLPGADIIDQLDSSIVGGAYHHEGPYDAALPARNTSFESSPVAAVAESNMEALKATPRENIQDSLERGVPLSGTAVVPPGQPDRFGRTYDYQEGENLMITGGGNYKRWPGLDYKPGDIKGKGEPTYSIEKSLKEANSTGTDAGRHVTIEDGVGENEVRRSTSLRRHESLGKKAAEGIKRRLGSLRRKEK